MPDFIAFGGALDPNKERPPIGGQAFLLTVQDQGLLIDYGVYPQPAPLRSKESEKILSERPQMQFKAIGNRGQFRIPIIDKRTRINPDIDFSTLVNYEQLPGGIETLQRLRKLFVVQTHAHADHGGGIPFLFRQCPNARLLMTRPTREISRWMWNDYVNISKREGNQPIFEWLDIRKLEEKIDIVDDTGRATCGPFELDFFKSGHMLGSVSVLVRVKTIREVRIFFTGDINFADQMTVESAPLLTDRILGKIDYLVTESTYGGRPAARTRKETEAGFVADVEACLGRGGKFLTTSLSTRIPELFSVADHYGITKRWPVHIDGSGCEIARIHMANASPGSSIAKAGLHFVQSADERMRLLTGDRPALMFASAGTLSGGWAVEYASLWGSDERNTIALTCYQDPCMPGHRLRKIREKSPGKIVTLGENSFPLRAEVKTYPFSGHAPGEDLARMVERIAPRVTLLTHGEEAAMDTLIGMIGTPVIKTLIRQPYAL